MKKDNRELYLEAKDLIGKELLEQKQRLFLLRLLKKYGKAQKVSPKEDFESKCLEIIGYLNQVTGKEYRASTSDTKALIRARLNDGFNVDEFKQVIDVKSAQWLTTDQHRYLRPKTLFGTKFEGYLQEYNSRKRKEKQRYTSYKEPELSPEEIKKNEEFKAKEKEILENYTEEDWIAFFNQLKIFKNEAYAQRLKHPIVKRMFVGWMVSHR